MDEAGFDYSRGVWTGIRPRLGERRPIGTAITWRLTAPSSRRPRRRPPTSKPAVMHDLSISGARLLMAADEGLAPRMKVDIELDGAWTSAQVAWVIPTEHTGELWCGVMFLDAGPDFLQAISRTIGPRRA